MLNKTASVAKMQKWHEATRRQNIKACSDEKLMLYYEICLELNFILEANLLYEEIVDRDLQEEVSPMKFNKAPEFLSVDQIQSYILHHASEQGDSGNDLFVLSKDNKIYYSWGYSDKSKEILKYWDCLIDIENNTIQFDKDEDPIDLDDTLEVITNINEVLFGC